MVIMDGVSVVGILILILCWVVYIPSMIWFYLKFMEHSEEAHFRKRRPSILGLNLLLAFLHVAVYRTNTILSVVMELYPVIPVVDSFLWAFTLCGLMYTFLLRVWLLFFDQNYTQASMIMNWKRDLDRPYVKWFLKNKSTFGKNKWMFQWMLIIWFIQMLIIVVIATTGDSTASFFVEGFLVLLPLLGIAGLWYKTSPHTDFFKIRTELRYFLMACVAGSFVAVVTLPIPDNRLRHLFYALTSATTITAFMMISTFWVLRASVTSSETDDEDAIHKVNHMDEIFRVESVRQGHEADLYSILRANDSLEIFLEHLIQEFSAENMLFLVDITHLKETLGVLKYMPEEMQSADTSPFTLNLPSDLPRSRLFTKFEDAIDRSRSIYIRYCTSESRFKVHISDETREELRLFFEAMYPPPKRRRDDRDDEKDAIGNATPGMGPSELDLFAIFDHARNEVLIMLRASFIRFRQTQQYTDLSEHIIATSPKVGVNGGTFQSEPRVDRSKSKSEQKLQSYIDVANVMQDEEPSDEKAVVNHVDVEVEMEIADSSQQPLVVETVALEDDALDVDGIMSAESTEALLGAQSQATTLAVSDMTDTIDVSNQTTPSTELQPIGSDFETPSASPPVIIDTADFVDRDPDIDIDVHSNSSDFVQIDVQH